MKNPKLSKLIVFLSILMPSLQAVSINGESGLGYQRLLANTPYISNDDTAKNHECKKVVQNKKRFKLFKPYMQLCEDKRSKDENYHSIKLKIYRLDEKEIEQGTLYLLLYAHDSSNKEISGKMVSILCKDGTYHKFMFEERMKENRSYIGSYLKSAREEWKKPWYYSLRVEGVNEPASLMFFFVPSKNSGLNMLRSTITLKNSK